MGVVDLWTVDEVKNARQCRPLARIALEGMENKEFRGLRLGIDASLWFFHVRGQEWGAAPELLTLFHRCCRLLRLGILPVFVLDGPGRPETKRNVRIARGAQAIERSFCEMAQLFGFEWRRAPGEAEAELAYLNAQGLIDAVMTDDSDVLAFHGKTIIRNWGRPETIDLSSGKARASSKDPMGNDDDDDASGPELSGESSVPANLRKPEDWVGVYTASRLEESNLGRSSLILMALMSGGDYDKGIRSCGIDKARAMAACGFGERLINAVRALEKDPAQFETFLDSWREEMKNELRTNQKGMMTRRAPSVADGVTPAFPNLVYLQLYANPLTSATRACPESYGDLTFSGEVDLPGLAAFCYSRFEWPRDETLQRLRNLVWPGLVMASLRLCALWPRGASAPRLQLDPILRPKPQRRHASTGNILEYRVAVDCASWADSATAALPPPGAHDPNVEKAAKRRAEERLRYAEKRQAKGHEVSNARERKDPEDPHSPIALWLPEPALRLGAPGFLAERDEKKASREAAKSAGWSPRKTKAKGRSGAEPGSSLAQRTRRAWTVASMKPRPATAEDAEVDPSPDPTPELLSIRAPVAQYRGLPLLDLASPRNGDDENSRATKTKASIGDLAPIPQSIEAAGLPRASGHKNHTMLSSHSSSHNKGSEGPLDAPSTTCDVPPEFVTIISSDAESEATEDSPLDPRVSTKKPGTAPSTRRYVNATTSYGDGSDDDEELPSLRALLPTEGLGRALESGRPPSEGPAGAPSKASATGKLTRPLVGAGPLGFRATKSSAAARRSKATGGSGSWRTPESAGAQGRQGARAEPAAPQGSAVPRGNAKNVIRSAVAACDAHKSPPEVIEID